MKKKPARKPVSDAAYDRILDRQIADIDKDLADKSNWTLEK